MDKRYSHKITQVHPKRTTPQSWGAHLQMSTNVQRLRRVQVHPRMHG